MNDNSTAEEGNEIDRDAENEASRFLRERTASRKVEAAPSDTDRPSPLELRRMTDNERAEVIMQYLADALGELGYELDSHEDTARFLQHVSAGFSRSQPVQVESIKERWDRLKALEEIRAEIASVRAELAEALESRTVQVEVTDTEAIVAAAIAKSDDENHEQLCACHLWPESCATYGDTRPWSHDAEFVARAALEAARLAPAQPVQVEVTDWEYAVAWDDMQEPVRWHDREVCEMSIRDHSTPGRVGVLMRRPKVHWQPVPAALGGGE